MEIKTSNYILLIEACSDTLICFNIFWVITHQGTLIFLPSLLRERYRQLRGILCPKRQRFL